MRRRRGPGEGSIYRRKDGRWVGQYWAGGKRRYVYGRTRREVAAELARAIAERNAGLVFDAENLSVGEYLSRWLDAIRGTVAERTWLRREQYVRIHIVPAIGAIRLDALNALHVQALYRMKLDEGLAPITVRMVHATLSRALKQAVAWRLIPHNVCAEVVPPRGKGREIRPLRAEQVRALLRAAEGDELYALYVLAVTTGMRLGELLALRWDCVDFAAGTVQVRGTVGVRGEINPPKTAKGRRTIKLSLLAQRALFDHRQRSSGGEWVFSNRAGNPYTTHGTVWRRWKRLVRAAGLPQNTRFHDLRHTACCLLLERGLSPRVVADVLGHSDVGFTLRVYAHVLPHMQNGAARAMDDVLSEGRAGRV